MSVHFSDRLFFEVGHGIREEELQEVFRKSEPVEIQFHEGRGYIRFSSVENAQRAYAIFNGTQIEPYPTAVRLSIVDPTTGSADPQPSTNPLFVKLLPAHTDAFHLYELARPYGILAMCRLVMDHGIFKGQAVLQYFDQAESDEAMADLHCKEVDGKTIAVTRYIMQRGRPLPAHIVRVQPTTPPRKTVHQQPTPASSPLTATPSSPADSPSIASSAISSPDSPVIDPTNLYVKNLDLRITSVDLFNAFRRFGRIISARVMTHPTTNQSRGFGFVSFSTAEEASRALQTMNGKEILAKPIVVAYHEPKKLREAKLAALHAGQPAPAVVFNPQREQVNQERGQAGDNKASGSESITPPLLSPSSDHLAVPGTIPKRSLRRRGSIESISSVMTERTRRDQREKMREAVRRVTHEYVDDIVDLLLTLKRKERSLCLFNPDYLKSKVRAARDALEIVGEESEGESEAVEKMKQLKLEEKTGSKDATTDAGHLTETEQFLATISHLSENEQKEKLGGRLYPAVKATGVKRANKVTIQLLDTEDLHELAKAVHYPEHLQILVDRACATLASAK
ncbi:uncharacterized protein VTP21DRAFT_9321 [Calcarisporiella thermophila]|uniref:uncharacterized protein n=1 Tax=Calcarisporiella thermophila TaxID=911321 RepID=UPI0037445C29